jgi:hopene-associated glycosyltransferase HpnB
LEQGRFFVDTELTLLLDADVELEPGILAALCAKLEREGLQLASLMVWLRMEDFWERLLMPAFVYFFKLLYPFRLANHRSNRYVAAAAGGCILLKSRVVEELGGFGSIRGALIDDCALARAVKSRGYSTWIGLTRSARSLRVYPSFADIWEMVARTAYTQLGYSVSMLFLCTAIMLCAFAVPLVGLFSGTMGPAVVSLAILAGAGASYAPTLAYYGRGKAWAVALPVVGILFLAMTWGSAVRHWTGAQTQWRGRRYGL